MKRPISVTFPALALAVSAHLALAGGVIQGETSNAMTRSPAAGVRVTLASDHDATEAALSPDERRVAYVRRVGKARADGSDDELWLVDSEGKNPPRRLLAPKPSDDPKANLTGFNNPAFSPDGRLLYVLTQAWVTSNAVHRIDTNSGATRYITDANSVAVVPKGRYAGHLVVQKHKYFKQGGSREAFWLVTPDGRDLRELNEVDAATAAIAGLD